MTQQSETDKALAEMRAYQRTNFNLLEKLDTNLEDFKAEYRADAKDTLDRIASLENTRSNVKGFIILFSKISFPVALVVLAAYMGSYYSSSNKTPQVTVEKKIDTK